MSHPVLRVASVLTTGFLASPVRAEASYEHAGNALVVLLCWALVFLIVLAAALFMCAQKGTAVPLLAPAIFLFAVGLLSQLVLLTAPVLPDSQATFWSAAAAIPLVAVAVTWRATSKALASGKRNLAG